MNILHRLSTLMHTTKKCTKFLVMSKGLSHFFQQTYSQTLFYQYLICLLASAKLPLTHPHTELSFKFLNSPLSLKCRIDVAMPCCEAYFATFTFFLLRKKIIESSFHFSALAALTTASSNYSTLIAAISAALARLKDRAEKTICY